MPFIATSKDEKIYQKNLENNHPDFQFSQK